MRRTPEIHSAGEAALGFRYLCDNDGVSVVTEEHHVVMIDFWHSLQTNSLQAASEFASQAAADVLISLGELGVTRR